ncbi:transposase, partial [Nostoc sp. 'Peltigera malacea cyanobiont' DB3992]|uniref:transposase n=1 Tax=Nostoc sp. 'Peltigera malacea cyanobiont' DB3992 TaxID=1206980 RepID=UPI00211E14FE
MDNPILIHATTTAGRAFGDPRLIKGAALYEAIRQHQSINIRQISRNWAEQMGYYRFLENE